jgi:5-methylcytosine-specific restriction endonuclease McrA
MLLFEFNPVPKPTHKRRKAKRGSVSRFSPATIKAILERDRYRCVRCGAYRGIEPIPHHIIFRSQMGSGNMRNGATVCRSCHDLAHDSKEVREWFERWRDEYLDEEGNYKKPTPFIMDWHD